MTAQQKLFLKYVRARMIFSLRLRSENEKMQPVYIPSAEIETRFFPYPKFNRKKEILNLVNLKELALTEVKGRFYYEALKKGGFDLNLLPTKQIPNDETILAMLNNLKEISLSEGAPSTEYFDLFLKYKHRPELFFTIDDFARRIHTPVSNFHRTHRPNILIDNKATSSLDVCTMQPLLLGKILFKAIGENEYSTWINEGKDIYLELQKKANLNTREEAKKKFFEILFSKPSNALVSIFGASNWVNWINNFKSKVHPLNPHSKFKPHSNLAWLLQKTEVKIMYKIWTKLVLANIKFLSVHDEIIAQTEKIIETKLIMKDVMRLEFEYFKIAEKETLLINPLVSELHQKFKDAESCGKLYNHPQQQRIGELWQGVIKHYHTPQLNGYLNELKQISVN